MKPNYWFQSVRKGGKRIIKENVGVFAGTKDPAGNYGIHMAAETGNVEIVQLLAPYELLCVNAKGQTALDVAVAANQITCINFLRTAMLPDSFLRQSLESSKWFSALFNDDTQFITENASRFANVRCQNPEYKEWTGLMVAALRGNAPAVSLLFPYEERLRQAQGKTALMIACENSRVNVVKILYTREAREIDHYGWCALMYAVDSKCLAAIQLLYPLECEIRNEFRKTAFDIGIDNKDPQVTTLLQSLRKHQGQQ